MTLLARFVFAGLISALPLAAQETAPAAENAAGAELDQLRAANTELQSRLARTESKLATALRSFALLETEANRLRSNAAQRQAESDAASSEVLTQIRSESDASKAHAEARIAALTDELRQNKDQLIALTAENAQLRTRLALVGAPAGATGESPTRPFDETTPALPAEEVPSIPTAATAQSGAPRQHIVVLGDNLARISEQYYGTASRWTEIFQANRDVLQDANMIPAGITLRIP